MSTMTLLVKKASHHGSYLSDKRDVARKYPLFGSTTDFGDGQASLLLLQVEHSGTHCHFHLSDPEEEIFPLLPFEGFHAQNERSSF